MSNKTPPLVIPVVIDSTGVDRGLSNVNNRLRRGVSGTGAGGGGGGGFGSGGALAAAALGAGAVAALSRPGKASSSHMAEAMKRSWMRNAPSWARDALRGANSYGPMGERFLGRVAMTAYEGFDPIVEGAEAMSAAHNKTAKAAAARERRRAYYSRQKFKATANKLQDRVSGIANKLNLGLSDFANIRSVAGVGAGIAAATMVGRSLYNFQESVADIENLRGDPLYGRIREASKRMNAAKPVKKTISQSFFEGALDFNRGKETNIERDARNFTQAVEDTGYRFGQSYEYTRNVGTWATLKRLLF
jgi:hypothetical protein